MRKFVFHTQLKTGSLAVLNRINALSNFEVLTIQVHIMKKGLNIDKSLIQTQLHVHVLPTISVPKTTQYFSLSFVSNTQLFPHFLTIKHSYSKRLAHTQL